MIEKVLVANRGEIALRIIRACKELGIRSVAVYSDADVNGLHVRYADESYRIGPPDPSESYLNIDRIVEVALECGADAIHPGYGFLSENPEFARRCEEEGIIFVGPSSRTLELSGDKLACKKEMERHGIPTIPGSEVAGEEDAMRVAKELGYPILLKSVYGGGGRGIRLVRDEEELQKALKVAMMEAKAAFGREELYIEKYIEGARHIEFQIFRDAYGHAVHLGERESSIQRRYQKLIELSPSPMLDEGMREEMGRMAVKAAEAIEYMNAGTIEFLVDRDRNPYFMEVNARLQVEHPVTEMVTGVDIVKEQLRLASGERLDLRQEQLALNGAAIECRINAEDPSKGFLPSVGEIVTYIPPTGPGIRVDSSIYPGYRVDRNYDPLLAKVIAHGRSYEEARLRMLAALEGMVIGGVETVIPFHLVVLKDEAFIKGDLSTDFIERRGILDRVRREMERGRRTTELKAAGIAAYLLAKNKLVPKVEAKREGRRWKQAYRYGVMGLAEGF